MKGIMYSWSFRLSISGDYKVLFFRVCFKCQYQGITRYYIFVFVSNVNIKGLHVLYMYFCGHFEYKYQGMHGVRD